MRIGVEANSYYKNNAGTGVYVRNIVDLIKEKYPEHEIVLFANSRKSELDLSKKSTIRRIFNGMYDIVWMQFILPLRLWLKNVDVLLCPAYLCPIYSPCPIIISILDMSFMRYPEICDKLFRLYVRIVLKIVKNRVNRILTISLFSKNEIIEIFKVCVEKIVVTYLACENISIVKINNDLLRNTYKIDSNFILFVSTLEPRKNLLVLIEAFSILKRSGNIKQKLVICGSKGWYYEEIFTKIKEFNLQNDIIFTGYVPREYLLMLYSSADLFVYPSLYEGFGLPVLEAMACGCPVIASQTSSLPEVAGDAAILFNPNDKNELATKILEVIENIELRKELVRKGYNQIKKFSWNTTVEETMKVILSVARRDRNTSNM